MDNYLDKSCLKCSKCDYQTGSKYCLLIHEKRHKVEKRFKCEDCDFVTIEKFLFIYHTSSHDIIPLTTTEKPKLKTHEKTHSVGEPLGCTICDFAAVNKFDLLQHANTHFNEEFEPSVSRTSYGSIEKCNDNVQEDQSQTVTVQTQDLNGELKVTSGETLKVKYFGSKNQKPKKPKPKKIKPKKTIPRKPKRLNRQGRLMQDRDKFALILASNFQNIKRVQSVKNPPKVMNTLMTNLDPTTN